MMKRISLVLILIVLVISIQACSSASPDNAVILETVVNTEPESEKVGVTEEIDLISVQNNESEDSKKHTIEADVNEKATEEVTEIPKEEDLSEDEQREEAAFTLWDNLLQKHVSNDGVVNYKSLKADVGFERCLSIFQGMEPNGEWSTNKEKAYWINVYNAFTIKLILDNYPLKSINDIKEPWDKKFIEIGDNKYTLNQIENEILRPKFKDARVHFAINCASYSCPPLSNRAFFPESLDKVLTQMAKNFLKDNTRNSITEEKVVVSKIFEWYKDDFDKGKGLTPFLNMYSRIIINQDAIVEYMEYNWDLNGK